MSIDLYHLGKYFGEISEIRIKKSARPLGRLPEQERFLCRSMSVGLVAGIAAIGPDEHVCIHEYVVGVVCLDLSFLY